MTTLSPTPPAPPPAPAPARAAIANNWLGLPAHFWRLLPGNPILQRVVQAAGKRRRDLVARWTYLAILMLVVAISVLSSGTNIAGMSLSELSLESGDIFRSLSYLQLGLVALLAPIFTAGAITQERDSHTYDILLTTPLTNGQIVLGTLLSRLYFVIALLVSGIPVFAITQVFGGVTLGAVALSVTVSAVTALVTGAVAITIATLRVGSGRTIFAFYLAIAFYLVGLTLLDQLPFFHPVLLSGQPAGTSWLTGLNPFLSLKVIFEERGYVPPELAELPASLRGWPAGWYLTHPTQAFLVGGTVFSLAVVLPSIALLRRLAKMTLSPTQWVTAHGRRMLRVQANRPPRTVWANPIAWREAKTRASAAKASLLRWSFALLGVSAATYIAIAHARMITPDQYVPASGISRLDNTVLIIKGSVGTTYQLAATTTVRVDGNQVSPFSVSQMLRVEQIDVTAGRNPYVRGLDLVQPERGMAAGLARQLLLGLILVEILILLLVVTNAAASTVTREKEDGTLDLLLTTPITSRYYIWGKLHGLVVFALPLIAVPTASLIGVMLVGFFASIGNGDQSRWLVQPESAVLLPVLLTILSALAAMVGMNLSLRVDSTVKAIMASVAIIGGVLGAAGWCGTSLVASSGNAVSLVFAGLSPVTSVALLLDGPRVLGTLASGDLLSGGQLTTQARLIIAVMGLLSAGVCCTIVWSMYKNMVYNFDMTLRRQSR